MPLLAALLGLRVRVLGRGVRDHAATVLLLGPLVAGAGLLLLARVAHDLGARGTGAGPAAGEPWLWAAGALAAGFAARGPASGAGDPWPTLPLPRAARGADRYLAGLARLAPVAAVLAVATGALGGGATRWSALAGLVAVASLLAVPARLPRLGPVAFLARARRAGLGGAVRVAVRLLPADLRPLAAQDLLLVGRGFSARAGVNAGMAAVALLAVGERALTAGPAGGRVGLLILAVAAWALASTVFVLWERQQPTLWFLADLGCPPVRLWRAKVAVAGLLGLLVGLCGALPWVAVSASVAWRAPVLGAAVGVTVGAMLMEGDGRPLLAGVISLIAALGVATLVVLDPLFALAAPPLAAYLERLAVPRVERRLGETARRL